MSDATQLPSDITPEANTDEFAPERGRSSALSAVGVVLAVGVVGFAVLLPIVSTAFGVLSGWVVSLVAGVAMIVGLAVMSRRRARVSHFHREIHWLSIVFPRLRSMLDQADAVADVNQKNAERHANMVSLLGSYRLLGPDLRPGPDAGPPTLNAPWYRYDQDAALVGLSDLATKAADAVIDADGEVTSASRGELITCLSILYLDQFHDPSPEEINAVSLRWDATDTRLRRVLAELIERHPVFEYIDQTRGKIEEALGAIVSDGIPTVAALVDQLKRSPTRIVANMNAVAVRFGFGSVDRDRWDAIATRLSGLNDAEVPAAVAKQFATRLAPDLTDDATADKARRSMTVHLELLYRNQYDRPRSLLWGEYTAAMKDELAHRLARHGPLAAADGTDEDGRTERVIRAVLGAVRKFELEVVADAMLHIDGLWQLVVSYARHLVDKGDLATSADWDDAIASKRFVDHLATHDAMPRSSAELSRIDAPRMVLHLLRTVGEESMSGRVRNPQEPEQPMSLVEPAALTYVSVGLFLMGEARPELARQLAIEAFVSPESSAVADVLLAHMHERRVRMETGGVLPVPLRELVREHHTWRQQATEEYDDELGARVLGAIRERLQHGVWPTEVPLPWMLEQLAERIIGETRREHPEASTIEALKGQVERLVEASDGTTSASIDDLYDKIATFDPSAAQAVQDEKLNELIVAVNESRAMSLDELTEAVRGLERADRTMGEALSALDQVDEELSRTVLGLTVTDGTVVQRVDTLVDVDRELTQAIEKMMEGVPATSGKYLLTWTARSGPMSRLIAAFTDEEWVTQLSLTGRYEMEHFTPYARLGTLADGESFDDFSANLEADFQTVYDARDSILGYVWPRLSRREPIIYVEQIGNAHLFTV